MIEIFEGRLGGGKTYTAVCRILAHLAKGGWLYTNIELDFPAIAEYVAKHYRKKVQECQITLLTMEQIPLFHKHIAAGDMTMPALAVLDEAHLFFNSRDWDKTSKDVLAFLTQSRKVSVDVIFISQSALNMDKQFARLVQYYWRFRDLRRLVIPIFNIAYPFPHILVIQCDYDGKLILSQRVVKITSEIWRCYQTNALLKPIDFAGDKRSKLVLEDVEKKPAIEINWRKWMPYAAGVVILIGKLWVVSQY